MFSASDHKCTGAVIGITVFRCNTAPPVESGKMRTPADSIPVVGARAMLRQPALELSSGTQQRLIVSQLTMSDRSGSKFFVLLRTADNSLLGPIAILIVLVRVLCFGGFGRLGRIRRTRGNKSSGLREFPRPGIRSHHHSLTLEGLIAMVVVPGDSHLLAKDSSSPVTFRNPTLIIVRVGNNAVLHPRDHNGDLAPIDGSPPGQCVTSDPDVSSHSQLGECFQVDCPGLVQAKVEPDFDPIRFESWFAL